MPKGVYQHGPHGRITKEELINFIKFTFREDIAAQLANAKYPHKLAVELYKEETGLVISAATAYRQRDKWAEVNGKIIRVKD